jgi:CTP:molybdopterin cytidylyltransferase MocA
VEATVRDLPVRIARNPDWAQGQSTSIRVGLDALNQPPPSNQDTSPKSPPFHLPFFFGNGGMKGGAIFLLADQPQVTPAVLRALVERHSLDLPSVVAPVVGDRRANPVLFDRETFPALAALSGDVGGRAIFSQYPPVYLPWHDESLLVDADRPEDLKKLRDR